MGSFFSSLFRKPKNTNDSININIGSDAYKTGCKLLDNQHYEEALKYFDIAINNGNQLAFSERGTCLKCLGFFIDSIEDFSKAIEFNPTDCNLYFLRAIAKNAIGDLPAAIADKNLAIIYSKLKNEENEKRDKVAKTIGSNTVTEYYELYMMDWEKDLEFDITMRDKYNQLKLSGIESKIKLANELLKDHEAIYTMNHKSR